MGALYRQFMMQQAAQEAAKTEQAKPEIEQEQVTPDEEAQPESGLTPDAVEGMTRDQLKAELKRMNVEFAERDSAGKLKEALLKALQ